MKATYIRLIKRLLLYKGSVYDQNLNGRFLNGIEVGETGTVQTIAKQYWYHNRHDMNISKIDFGCMGRVINTNSCVYLPGIPSLFNFNIQNTKETAT